MLNVNVGASRQQFQRLAIGLRRFLIPPVVAQPITAGYVLVRAETNIRTGVAGGRTGAAGGRRGCRVFYCLRHPRTNFCAAAAQRGRPQV